MRLCLWSPFQDRELRFVLNRALFDPTSNFYGRDRNKVRHELRAPTSLGARIIVSGREKPALIYNLSIGGCYLETVRPTLVGALGRGGAARSRSASSAWRGAWC